MKIKNRIIVLLLAPIALFFLTAGHHFETDLAKKYPEMDLLDLFVFKSTESNKTVLLADINPKSKKDSFNFSSKGIYKFHIAKNKEFDKGQLFSFTFKNNEVQMYWDDQPENSLHETGTLIAKGPINRVLELDNGIKIWTGTTHDNFQGNAVGAEAFKHKVLEKKEYDLSTFDVGEKGNFFGKGNAAVIVFEIPNEFLPEDIFYYASTSLEEEPGHWHQVNHIANVLFPHFYMGYDDKLRSKYGSQGAVVDEEIKQNVIENLSNYVNAAGIQKDTDAYLKQLMERIYPDIVPYKIGTKAHYGMEKFNGRPLHEDAMNVTLGLMVGSETPIDDKVAIKLERYQPNFPYTIPIDKAYIDALDKRVKVVTVNAIKENEKNYEYLPQKDANELEGEPFNIWSYILIGMVVLFGVFILFSKKK